MRVLCVPWKRDIPLDLALGRTIDTRARRVAILEHVRKTHTHGFAGMRSGMCDLVVCNDRQIDSHGCANQGLIGGIAWSRPARKWKLRGSMRKVSRTFLVSRETRFRSMTADKVYVAGKRAVILRLTVKPYVHFISLLFPRARIASVSMYLQKMSAYFALRQLISDRYGEKNVERLT